MPNPYVNKVAQSNGTILIDISDTTAVAADVAEGKYFYLATGEKVPGTAETGGGGGPTTDVVIPEQTLTVSSAYTPIPNVKEALIEGEEYIYTLNDMSGQKTAISQYGSIGLFVSNIFIIENANGTMYFDVMDSSLYGSYTIKVEKITSSGGGASNIVTGTFKGTTTGAAMDVDLNYSGTGYPIAVLIFPSDADASTFQSTIQRYAVRSYMMDKYDKTSAPVYAGSTGYDYAASVLKYKSSTTNSRSLSNGGATNATTLLYVDESATADITKLVKIRSNKKLSVFIASTSYGFMANIEYSYVVIYSS